MTAEVGIKDRIEQRSDRPREPRGNIQRAAIFDEADELTQPLVKLNDKKAVEGDAVLVKPEEGALIHQRDAGIAQRHHVVAPRLFLEHGTLAKPRTRGE